MYGCFLSYYSDYFESSLDEFLMILESAGDDYCCIVIVNGNLTADQLSYSKSKGCTLLPGDNRIGEFSGWQKALEHIKSNFDETLLLTDCFIFANDTFNQHRLWGFKDRLSVMAGIMESQKYLLEPVMVGHAQYSQESFSIGKLYCSEWVSTFLFVTNLAFINNIKWEMALSNIELEEFYSKVDFDGIEWLDSINEGLQLHINSWLFPATSKCHSWYAANTKTPRQKQFKLNAILNEKYLSAKCISDNGKLISWTRKLDFLSLIAKNIKPIFCCGKLKGLCNEYRNDRD